MRRSYSIALAISAATLAVGCGSKDNASAETLDKGQVVATVDGQDVTVYELNAEMQGVNATDPKQRKQIEQAALQQVINRKILAGIARERGLDKSPDFLIQQRRNEDNVLVSMLRNSLASKLSPPTREEAGRFMESNPNMFAERKIYVLDQIHFRPSMDMNKLNELKTAKTMGDVESWLVHNNVDYQRTPGSIDASRTNPDLIAKIAALPSGEVFLVPSAGEIVANQITQVKTQPFTGEDAMTYAMNIVQSRKLVELAKKDIEKLLDDKRKAVKYQAGYTPPAPAKAPPSDTNAILNSAKAADTK